MLSCTGPSSLGDYSNNSSSGSLAFSVMGMAEAATNTFTAAPLAAPKVGRAAASIQSSRRDCASCLPAQLAIDHLPGQRADLGAVELVDVVVGLLPVEGRGGPGNRGGCTVAIRNPVPALTGRRPATRGARMGVRPGRRQLPVVWPAADRPGSHNLGNTHAHTEPQSATDPGRAAQGQPPRAHRWW